ncbi:hypothetical protein ABH908_000251 [Pseudomonas frederiksbergensis]|uniref:hypothetical protein n=1 Tax=Pseudomonas TaxID=286 RepID=UPI003D22D680
MSNNGLPPITHEQIEALRERYTTTPLPPCRVCGAPLTVASMGGGKAPEYACSNATDANGKTDLEHYGQSKHTHYGTGDSDVIAALDALSAMADLFKLGEPAAWTNDTVLKWLRLPNSGYAQVSARQAGQTENVPLFLAPGPPPGWKLVPIKPTPEMVKAVDGEAEDKDLARGRAVSAWGLMLDAAPATSTTNTSDRGHCPHCGVCHTSDETCIQALQRLLLVTNKANPGPGERAIAEYVANLKEHLEPKEKCPGCFGSNEPSDQVDCKDSPCMIGRDFHRPPLKEVIQQIESLLTTVAEAGGEVAVGTFDPEAAGCIRWKDGIVRGDFNEGDPIYCHTSVKKASVPTHR